MFRLPVWICDGTYVPNGIAVLFTDEEPYVQVMGTEESSHIHRGASMSIGATEDGLRYVKSTLRGNVDLKLITEEMFINMWDAFVLALLRHYFEVRKPELNHVPEWARV